MNFRTSPRMGPRMHNVIDHGARRHAAKVIAAVVAGVGRRAARWSVRWLCGWLACQGLAVGAVEPRCDDPRVLRVALIPKSQVQRQQQEFAPLQRALEKALQRRVEVATAPSYGAVMEGLLSDSVDLAELGPASYALLVQRNAAVVPFAALSGKGEQARVLGTYRSVLIARRDRGLAQLADLRGLTLSLTDPASTSGNLVPRQFVAQQTGTSVEHYFRRVTYAGSHDRAIEAIRKGQVDAGFVSRTRYDEAIRLGRISADEMAILWQSQALPLDPFVLRSRLCPGVQEKVRAVFFQPEPLRALLQARGAERFVPVSAADYQGMQAFFAPR